MNANDKYKQEHSAELSDYFLTRRQFLNRAAMGFGALGLAALFGEGMLLNDAQAADSSAGLLLPKQPHFPAKAKHVVHIFAQGAPSHVDTWDPKPSLTRFDGKSIPGSDGVAMASPFKFTKQGKSGIEVSEVFPKLGEHVDKMTVLRSLWTDIPDHDTASRFLMTGSLQLPKPSLGSWVVYGLGYANK